MSLRWSNYQNIYNAEKGFIFRIKRGLFLSYIITVFVIPQKCLILSFVHTKNSSHRYFVRYVVK